MSADGKNSAGQPAALSPFSMPPTCLVLDDFLDAGVADDLLAYAIAAELGFAPTKVGPKETINSDFRNSLGTRELGPFRPLLKKKLREMVAEFIAALKSSPVGEPRIELELVAHNDGAFFKRHIDTRVYASPGTLRVLSGIYYVRGPKKGFSGGALRLHAISSDAAANFVDIEPCHNRFVLFPSWAPHEVMPIVCPSRRFADSRFSVNCWIHDRSRGDNTPFQSAP